MGKIHYRPKNNKVVEDKVKDSEMIYEEKEAVEEVVRLEEEEEDKVLTKQNIREAQKLDNVKEVGDTECAYHIYLEDYVYTYLYQYAQSDLSKESAAVFIGKFYEGSNEAVVTGILPITKEVQSEEYEWMDEAVLAELEQEKEEYFKGQEIIGWMHMQPGYGTMLTMKELREHRAMLGDKGRVFMLLDPINKVETLFAYENGELLEQSGYFMYYQRNEAMQRYMVEHPFQPKEADVIEDTVVNQFREIGKMRKQEYMQRKNVNVTVIAASVLLIALTAVIVKMNDSKTKNLVAMGNEISQPAVSTMENQDSKNKVEFMINTPAKNETKDLNEVGVAKEEVSKQEEPAQTKEDKKVESIVAENVEVKIEDEALKNEETQNKEVAQKEKVEEKQEVVEEESVQASAQVKDDKKEYDIYVVKDGDTLANIVFNHYGNTVRAKEVADLNGVSNTNVIRVGQNLKLPK